MSYYPICLPDDVEIHHITRAEACPNTCDGFNPCGPIPIDITTSSCNVYIACGINLHKIVSATWYPAHRSQIIFKMLPWQVYSPVSGDATFGILIQDQETYDHQRGGVISFRVASGKTASIPAFTFSSYPWLFHPTEIPLQGWDTGFNEGGGGVY